MTFPTANSTIIRNEDGEPVGFETNYDDAAYWDFYDEGTNLYGDQQEGDEPDVWGDEAACREQGYHAESGNSVPDRDDVWQCTACGGHYPREN